MLILLLGFELLKNVVMVKTYPVILNLELQPTGRNVESAHGKIITTEYSIVGRMCSVYFMVF